mmetsp:Transcript_40666/g.105569  ORF Transcript_40666/g.105569 Transcript_40666/m.105569 type:complete len:333 (-) Transcript_40666:88-1086(-)
MLAGLRLSSTLRKAALLSAPVFASSPSRSFFQQGGVNLFVNVVPTGYVYVIERLGKKNRELGPGFHLVAPFVERIAYVRGTRDSFIDVQPQHLITKDNISVSCTGTIFYRIVDVDKSCYSVENPLQSCQSLAEAVMRKKAGNMELDELLRSRSALNNSVREELLDIEKDWGIYVHRYEVTDIIIVDEETRTAMREQSDAERKRRAAILKSEGQKTAEVNKSEGIMISAKNVALGEAESVLIKAKADAEKIRMLADANSAALEAIRKVVNKDGGLQAAQMQLGAEYVNQLTDTLGRAGTVVVPQDALNIGSVVAQATSIMKSLNEKPSLGIEK